MFAGSVHATLQRIEGKNLPLHWLQELRAINVLQTLVWSIFKKLTTDLLNIVLATC